MKKIKKKYIVPILLLIPVFFSLVTKSPEGTSIKSDYYEVADAAFLYDLSYQKDGKIKRELTILERELEIIAHAEKFIVADLFLYNDAYPRDRFSYPNSVEQITDALIHKKKEMPDIKITLITDPINNFYGAYEQKYLTKMKENGINVVVTQLDELKDSNVLFSGYYRIFLQWFGTEGVSWIKNPFDEAAPKINIRSALKLTNFKANHRKLIVTDKEGIVTSANPHDPSSYHSNVALYFKSPIINDILQSEKVVADFSKADWDDVKYDHVAEQKGNTKIRLLTEKGIFDAMQEQIGKTQKGDTIQIGIFYLSDFDTIKALEKAAKNGVSIKIIADPNKDAFGLEKKGVPNRPVLDTLFSKSENIEVKWYHTNGEQYHGKMIAIDRKEESVIILGSGNFTRRNIKGYNLETDVEIVTDKNGEVAVAVRDYFDRLWNNRDGEYTLDYEAYQDKSLFHKIQWKIQEATGLSTF